MLFLVNTALLFSQPIIKNYTTNDGLPSNEINCVTVDSKKNLWVGTDQGLVLHANNQWKTFTVESTQNKLKSNFISKIVEDATGNIFISSISGGGTHVNKRLSDGTLLDTTWSLGSVGSFSGVCAKNSTICYTGQSGWELLPYFFVLQETILDSYLHTNTILTETDLLNAITIDKDSNCVLTTHDGKFYNYTPDSKELNSSPIPQCNGYVSQSHLSLDGTLWIAFADKGIGYYNNAIHRNQWNYLTTSDGLVSNTNLEVLTHKKKVWIASLTDGIQLMCNNIFTLFSKDKGLICDTINDICTDSHGNLWVATEKGLSNIIINANSINKTKKQQRSIDTKLFTKKRSLKILSNSPIYSIVVYTFSGKKLFDKSFPSPKEFITLNQAFIIPKICVVQVKTKDCHFQYLVRH